uniref:Uncharacterized protein n=1 Tax=Theropithecus gelada TaxID=9565 RepID=A0A8D2FXW7_THEGE
MLLILLSVALLALSSAQNLHEGKTEGEEDVVTLGKRRELKPRWGCRESHKDHPNKEAMPSRLSHLLLESPRDHHPLLKGADPPDLPRDSLPSNLAFNDRYYSS